MQYPTQSNKNVHIMFALICAVFVSVLFLFLSSKPANAQACDPNYEGACVPIASDVDCAGDSGNGPAYVQGPVYVVGRDIYDLDSDGDGVGCES